MPTGFVMMTALPPTRGHAYLINFAAEYMRIIPDGELVVMLCSRPSEPISPGLRAAALSRICKTINDDWVYNYVHFVHYYGDGESVPQNPSEHPDFWGWWKAKIAEYVNKPIDYVFASEKYGIELAKTLDATFVPCDSERDIMYTRATDFRQDPLGNFAMLAPEIQPYFRRRVTFFGAESCGKTEMSRHMADVFNGVWVHEWARPYLEMVGPEVTPEKMSVIVRGQYAAMKAAKSHAEDSPLIIQDTDLLSTLGYYRIMGVEPDPALMRLHKETESDLYIVMNDKIPFTPDPLRYGGAKRESDMQFWINLLEEHKRKYYVVQSTDRREQDLEIRDKLRNWYVEECGNLHLFQRT